MANLKGEAESIDAHPGAIAWAIRDIEDDDIRADFLNRIIRKMLSNPSRSPTENKKWKQMAAQTIHKLWSDDGADYGAEIVSSAACRKVLTYLRRIGKIQ